MNISPFFIHQPFWFPSFFHQMYQSLEEGGGACASLEEAPLTQQLRPQTDGPRRVTSVIVATCAVFFIGAVMLFSLSSSSKLRERVSVVPQTQYAVASDSQQVVTYPNARAAAVAAVTTGKPAFFFRDNVSQRAVASTKGGSPLPVLASTTTASHELAATAPASPAPWRKYFQSRASVGENVFRSSWSLNRCPHRHFAFYRVGIFG